MPSVNLPKGYSGRLTFQGLARYAQKRAYLVHGLHFFCSVSFVA